MEDGRGKREEKKCKVQNGYAPNEINEINETNVHDIKNL
jgi:hypothetical protein